NLEPYDVAVVGGGIAGATCATHFAEQGLRVALIEKGSGLIDGPPICHLHAGGNLYRELDDEQCDQLLKQSIDMVRLYPQTLNIRPTVIATPITDNNAPSSLLPRLLQLQSRYKQLIDSDSRNKVLGEPEQYYTLYDYDELKLLQQSTLNTPPKTTDDWVARFARHVDLDQLKYPLVVANEPGWSVFRVAASAQLTLFSKKNADVFLNTELLGAEHRDNHWVLTVNQDTPSTIKATYFVNACGFETGTVDDMVGFDQQRLVEFKAAYVSQWYAEPSEYWPEVIFHGERGTPQGMAQLTPYGDGVFQLHGMTQDITLFKQGLTASNAHSAQPKLDKAYSKKIKQGWSEEVLNHRTQRAIEHISQFLPAFSTATPNGKALFGAQQIPGKDATRRVADVSFEKNNYARVEVIKGSSALEAALKMTKEWKLSHHAQLSIEEQHPMTTSHSQEAVEALAIALCEQRGYPVGLAKVIK
ncbi:FAD-binding oxidoreductase, partial [Vibrio sp.]|nr:FAD-binding oxidoreductase [Vibrio sp.]